MNLLGERRLLGVIALILAGASSVVPLDYVRYFTVATGVVLAIDQFLGQPAGSLPKGVNIDSTGLQH